MKRTPLILIALALLAAAPAATARTPAAAQVAWAAPSVRAVLAHGAFPHLTSQSFHPEATLTAGALEALARIAAPDAAPVTPADPAAPVTMADLHRRLVIALGLGDAARALQAALTAARLHPHPGAGFEVAARTLGLTYNHPAGTDALERSPDEPATRAEAAWSTARALGAGAKVAAAATQLSDLDAYLASLTGTPPGSVVTAIGFLGAPYVWGGEWEGRDSPLGGQAHGGFDCSGLVVRSVVLRPGGLPLRRLGGRTTYEMAAATPASARVARADLRPGDLILFGDGRGPRTPSGAIGHMALSLGGEWFVHSSSQGVTIERLAGWYARAFAFGRRPGGGVVPPAAPVVPTSPLPPPPTVGTGPATLLSLHHAGGTLVPGVTHLATIWRGPPDPRVSVRLRLVPLGPVASPGYVLADRLPSAGTGSFVVPVGIPAGPVQLVVDTFRGGLLRAVTQWDGQLTVGAA